MDLLLPKLLPGLMLIVKQFTRVEEYGISKRDYSEISEDFLYTVVRKELLKYPDIGNYTILILTMQITLTVTVFLGLEFLNRHLQHSLQIRVQRWRLRQAVVMIRGHEGMKNRRLHRRRYKVRAPLSMVHVDTHHKLIR